MIEVHAPPITAVIDTLIIISITIKFLLAIEYSLPEGLLE